MSIPIPPRPNGYRIGLGNALIQTEVFVDIECPFSKRAWETLQKVVAGWGEQVAFTAVPTVLCDHRQSWDLTKAATLVADGEPERFWRFFSYLYERQSSFSAEAFKQKSQLDLHNLISEFIEDFSELPDRAYLLKKLASEQLEKQAKHSVRYAIARGIWSTPTFLINGAKADSLDSSATVSDWQTLLDSLLRQDEN
ncbi:MAG: thioredoxin domain-containing protein [Leptolyngbyaceae cyanobacterium RM1_1_2]|nr:thioredoxin domain-containing protein [Leptolyngbyaceae cyanobacterium RM1_1_2]